MFAVETSLMKSIIVRNARPEEFPAIGQLLVNVYSQLEGFPKPDEQPKYYELLSNVGALTEKHGTELLVAELEGTIAGAVVYFSDMQHYGSGGTATQETNSSGFRLLAVDRSARNAGIGRILTNECISRAKANHHKQLIIHTTLAMQTAWKMYEGIGFNRAPELDFMQGPLKVFGFRYALHW